jgi:hypothetical protein
MSDTMTYEQFEEIFDGLYYACVQPTENSQKIYQARSRCYWAHFQHVRREFFAGAVDRYLVESTDGPFFPALGDLRAISGGLAQEAKELADKAEVARLRQEYPDAAKQAAENEQIVASLTARSRSSGVEPGWHTLCYGRAEYRPTGT